MKETRSNQGAGTRKAKQNNNNDLLCCTLGNICPWVEKTNSKCDEQSQPKPKQHAPNAIQQVSNAPNVDKKSSIRKICLFGGIAPLAVASEKKNKTYEENILCSRRSAENVFAVGVEPHIPESNTIHELLGTFKLTVATENRFDKFATCIAAH